MGTTQSKKRRKDMQKKKRGSITLDYSRMSPRSISVDALHPLGVVPCPSSCPLCPHCRFSVSWSSDHSLTHSLCLHHARQEQREASRNVLEKEGFVSSCPDCVKASSSSCSRHCLQLCEMSSQDHNDISTMSLNRDFPGRSNEKSTGISQSKSAEFSDFRRIEQCSSSSQRKENINPKCYNSSNQQAGLRKKVGENRWTTTAVKKQTESSTRQSVVNTVTMSKSSVQPLSSVDVVTNNNNSKQTKSNLSLLDDEEEVVSRWVRRKQMAQELRNLRMHLQHEEDARQQTTNPHNSFVDFKLCAFGNDNNTYCNVDEKIANKSYAPTTTSITKLGNVVDITKQEEDLSDVNTVNKDSVSKDLSTATDTNTTATTTTTATTSPTRRSVRSKFSRLKNYRYLDNHPVMTRLQNEQNNRLELMERRMEEIRINAMREAERRRFAEIFPAKDDDTETQKLLREARESLERMNEEKRKKSLSSKDQHQQRYQNQSRASSEPPRSNYSNQIWRDADSRSEDDSGEIIPVIRVLSSSRESTPVSSTNRSQKKIATVREKNNCNNNKSLWLEGDWPDINLGKPLTWLWLPFLLFPLVLRMLVSMIINSLSTPVTPPRNSNSVNAGCHHPDRNRHLARDKRKKSC